MRLVHLAAVIGFCSACANCVFGAIDYSSIGSTYSQTFDGLANSGTGDWANDSTFAGWSLFRINSAANPTPYVAITTYETDDGGANTARFYSYGATASTERALGAVGGSVFGDANGTTGNVGAGVVVGWIAMAVTNNTGAAISEFTLKFDGEQWRDGGNDPATAQTMTFEYGFGSTFAGVGPWTAPGSAFNFVSPVNNTTDGAVPGNSAGRIADLGGTIASLSWLDGATLWLRWVERNDAGFDHGLAIDNVSFVGGPIAVPEANAFAFGALVVGSFSLTAAVANFLCRFRRSDDSIV